MEPENINKKETTNQVEETSTLYKVTPLSKYLAMALFIALPFIGGYVGYVFAPEEVVEKEVTKEAMVSAPNTADRVFKTPNGKDSAYRYDAVKGDIVFEPNSEYLRSFYTPPKNELDADYDSFKVITSSNDPGSSFELWPYYMAYDNQHVYVNAKKFSEVIQPEQFKRVNTNNSNPLFSDGVALYALVYDSESSAHVYVYQESISLVKIANSDPATFDDITQGSFDRSFVYKDKNQVYCGYVPDTRLNPETTKHISVPGYGYVLHDTSSGRYYKGKNWPSLHNTIVAMEGGLNGCKDVTDEVIANAT